MQMTTYYSLNQAKERREKVDESREFIVTAKNEQAFQRAKEVLQFKQDKLRSMCSKVIEVKERRTMLEQERRKHVMASMKSRLSSATTRADSLVLKRQSPGRCNKRRTQAIERRNKVNDSRVSILNVRNEKAFLRAKESMQFKQDKLRNMFSKVTIVKERRTMLEQKRRKRVITSMESRINSALTRAEHLVQLRQGRVRYDKRRKRVHAKRASLEFERRSQLLSTIDNRAERVTRNLKLRLRDRQYKAREDTERAACVSRRVKAARLLQKVLRNKLGLGNDSDFEDQDDPSFYQNAAAFRLQNFWRTYSVIKRINNDNKLPSPMKSLAFMLANMSPSAIESLSTEEQFEGLSSNMTQTPTLKSAQSFLNAFHPFLQCVSSRKVKSSVVSSRILLSAFLVVHHPDEVLGEKRNTDVCSKLLEKASKTLIDLLQSFANSSLFSKGVNAKSMHVAIRDLVSSLVRYSTLFNVWKHTDYNELISHMSLSAEQSWVAYFTSKNALSYGNERMMTLLEEHDDGVLFQNRLRHESTKNGAQDLIKRIRTSFYKLVGKEEAIQIMKHAKQSAIQKIKSEDMMAPLKVEIDNEILAAANNSKSLRGVEFEIKEEVCLDQDEEQTIKNSEEEIPANTFPNADLVHKILLTGSDNVEDLLVRTPNGYKAEIFDTANNYMTYWHQRLSNTDSEVPNTVSLEGATAMTMECAYFDKIEYELTENQSLVGIQDLILNLCHKMRQLVPNRTDLHSCISDDDVMSCRSTADALRLLVKMSCMMSNDLEAPYRSMSTVEWQQSTEAYLDLKVAGDSNIPYEFGNPEAFLVASISFLIKKIDLCHLDKMNFELVKVVPLICQMGGEYEQKNFQAKYGMFGSMSLVKDLSATWGWMQRSHEALTMSPDMLIDTLRTDCFVDGLLFVQDAIPMPEVMALDGELIVKVRRLAQTAVIGSALFLHACSIFAIPTCQLNPLTSQAKYHRDQLVALLKSKPSYDSISEALTNFVEAVKRTKLEPEKKASLRILVERVCNANDAVLKLLDIRMRQLFKFACVFDSSARSAPTAMRTGISNGGNKSGLIEESSSDKAHFMAQCEREAQKLGFGVFSNDIIEAAYEASKAINHSLSLYKEDVFFPILNQMIAMNAEE